MKIAIILIVALVALVSIAAGIAKVMQVPEEVEFLQSFDFSISMIVTFGVVQIIAGALLCHSRTRFCGAIISCLAFTISAFLIFVSGNIPFGLFSLLPIILTIFIIYQASKINNIDNN